MDKQKHNKGFTLIEMIIVLLLISILVCLFPMMKATTSTMILPQMEMLKARLLMVQQDAIINKQRMDITLLSNQMIVNGKIEEIPVSCYQQLSFNEHGNVSRAMSISCSLMQQQATLVIQLGSGRMYVK